MAVGQLREADGSRADDWFNNATMSALRKGLHSLSGIMGVALVLTAIINEFYILKDNIRCAWKRVWDNAVKNSQKHADIMLHCNRGRTYLVFTVDAGATCLGWRKWVWRRDGMVLFFFPSVYWFFCPFHMITAENIGSDACVTPKI